MTDPIILHRRQYDTTDVARHVGYQTVGLLGHEKYHLAKYFKPDLPVLEIGTGAGRVALTLPGLGYQDVTGIDLSPVLIAQANKAAVRRELFIKFRVGNVTKLDVPDGSCPQVICCGVVLSHLPSLSYREQALREITRILTPGGIALLDAMNLHGEWHVPVLREATRFSRWLLGNPYGYTLSDLPRLGKGGRLNFGCLGRDIPQMHYFTTDELVGLCQDAGLTVVEVNCGQRGGGAD